MLFSIQEWVLESLWVPYALLVEYEKFLGFHVAENHVLVEHISCPDELVLNGFGWNLLDIFDVDDMLRDLAKEEWLVENNLLRVRQEFCVPCEISLLSPSSWNEGQWNQRRQQEEVSSWKESPCSPEENDCEVGVSPFKSPVSLFTLIEENTIFVGLNSIEVTMSIDNCSWCLWISKKCSDKLQNQSILEDSLISKHVISWVLLNFVVH